MEGYEGLKGGGRDDRYRIRLVRTNADGRRVEVRIGSAGLEGTSGVGAHLST